MDGEEAINLAAPELQPAMKHWSELGLPIPEVGFELDGPGGRVIAEAELAWPGQKVAVLLPEQEPCKRQFEKAGWRVLDGAAEGIVDVVAAALDA